MPPFDVNTTTPGSAVADTLQWILQRRRDQQRQAMLDKLESDRVYAGIDNNRRQLDMQSQQEQRLKALTDAQIAESRERVVESQIDSLGQGEMEITDEWKTGHPELYGELVKRQRIRKDPGAKPMVETSYGTALPTEGGDTGDQPPDPSIVFEGATPAGPVTPAREFYKGSPDFEKNEVARRRLGEIMANPEFAKLSELQKALMLIQAGAMQNVPEEAIAGPRQVVPIKPTGEKGTPVPLGPRDVAMELGYAPVGASLVPSYSFLGMLDKDGNPLFGSNRPGPDGRPVVQPGAVSGGVFPRPTNAQDNLIPPTLSGELSRAHTATGADREARLAQARSAIASGARGMTPRTHQFVLQAFESINRAAAEGRPMPSVQQVMGDLMTNLPDATDKEYTDVNRIMFQLLNGNVTN